MRGFTVLPAIVLVAILGVVAVGIKNSAPRANSLAQTAALTPATESIPPTLSGTESYAQKSSPNSAEVERIERIKEACIATINKAARAGGPLLNTTVSGKEQLSSVKDDCVGAIRKTPGVNTNPNDPRNYTCVGKTARVFVNGLGGASVTSSPNEGVPAGTCKTYTCDKGPCVGLGDKIGLDASTFGELASGLSTGKDSLALTPRALGSPEDFVSPRSGALENPVWAEGGKPEPFLMPRNYYAEGGTPEPFLKDTLKSCGPGSDPNTCIPTGGTKELAGAVKELAPGVGQSTTQKTGQTGNAKPWNNPGVCKPGIPGCPRVTGGNSTFSPGRGGNTGNTGSGDFLSSISPFWKGAIVGGLGGGLLGWMLGRSGSKEPENKGGGGGGIAVEAELRAEVVCQPRVADAGTTLTIAYSCSSGTASSSAFPITTQPSGLSSLTIATPPPGTNIATYALTCASQGRTANSQCLVQVSNPAVILVANPKTVPANGTSILGWLTRGMRSCVISSPDQSDFTSRNSSNTSVSGIATTSPISSQATFLLRCETLGGGSKDATTTVTIAP